MPSGYRLRTSKAFGPGRTLASLCLGSQGSAGTTHSVLGQECPGDQAGVLKPQARVVRWLLTCWGPGVAFHLEVEDVAPGRLKAMLAGVQGSSEGPCPSAPLVWPKDLAREKGPRGWGKAGQAVSFAATLAMDSLSAMPNLDPSSGATCLLLCCLVCTATMGSQA